MERRRALVIAGTVTASLAMAGGALAANMGLLGSAGADVGKLDASNVSELQGSTTTAGPDVTVIVQDIPVPAVGSTTGGAPPPAVVTPPSGGYVDDEDDHGEYEDHDGEYEDHDDENDDDD